MTLVGTFGTCPPGILSLSAEKGAGTIDAGLAETKVLSSCTLVNVATSPATSSANNGQSALILTGGGDSHSSVSIAEETVLTNTVIAALGQRIGNAHGKGVTFGIFAHMMRIRIGLANVGAESVHTITTKGVTLVGGGALVNVVAPRCTRTESSSIAIETLVANTIIAKQVVVGNTGSQIVASIRPIETSLARNCQSRSVSIFTLFTIEATFSINTSLVVGTIMSISDTLVQVLATEPIANISSATSTLRCYTSSCISTDSIIVTVMCPRETTGCAENPITTASASGTRQSGQ